MSIHFRRALGAALTFNLEIDNLMLTSLEDDAATASFMTNYLAALHALHRLYISPFGFKLTPATIVQSVVPLLALLVNVAVKNMDELLL